MIETLRKNRVARMGIARMGNARMGLIPVTRDRANRVASDTSYPLHYAHKLVSLVETALDHEVIE